MTFDLYPKNFNELECIDEFIFSKNWKYTLTIWTLFEIVFMSLKSHNLSELISLMSGD